MLGIWRNFFVGRSKSALVGIILVALLLTATGFLTSLVAGMAFLVVWVFGVPCAVYCIDYQSGKFDKDFLNN